MLLRFIYIIFTGILVSLFIGVGIATFYKAPKAPEYPISVPQKPYEAQPASSESAAQATMRDIEYQRTSNAYMTAREKYARNVSILALTASIIILIISLTIVQRLPVINDGLLLGSVFTLIYSIIRGFEANDETFRFIVVTIGLIIALFLGYIKFIKPGPSKKIAVSNNNYN